MARLRAWLPASLCLCTWLLVGCTRQATDTPNRDAAQKAITTPATRVVSLTPGITELLYAVDAQSLLVASVDYADYPTAARALPRIGDAFRVDAERLLALRPDLVLAGGSHTPQVVQGQVRALGLRLVNVEAQRINDVAQALRQVGQLTGRHTQAEQAAQQYEAEVAQLRARYHTDHPLSVFIEVNRQPLYTVNGQQIISEVLTLCGGRNVFADLSALAPMISVEAVLQANPDVIISTESSKAELINEWQRYGQLRAVQSGHLYVVAPDTLTRATPRLTQGIEAICRALQGARA